MDLNEAFSYQVRGGVCVCVCVCETDRCLVVRTMLPAMRYTNHSIQ